MTKTIEMTREMLAAMKFEMMLAQGATPPVYDVFFRNKNGEKYECKTIGLDDDGDIRVKCSDPDVVDFIHPKQVDKGNFGISEEDASTLMAFYEENYDDYLRGMYKHVSAEKNFKPGQIIRFADGLEGSFNGFEPGQKFVVVESGFTVCPKITIEDLFSAGAAENMDLRVMTIQHGKVRFFYLPSERMEYAS